MIREENVMPDISPFVFYADAYRELSTCRNGMNNRIPFTAIAEYAKVYNVEDFFGFTYLIRSMEDAQIENEKVKDGPTNPSKRNKSNR